MRRHYDSTPEHYRYGISPEQAATDLPPSWVKPVPGLTYDTLPPAGPSNVLPQASVHPLAVLLIVVIVGLALVYSALSSPAKPMPTPASREASLARQVEALSTRVVELEWRNTATLEALGGFAPVPTSTHEPNWTYTGPYAALNGNAR